VQPTSRVLPLGGRGGDRTVEFCPHDSKRPGFTAGALLNSAPFLWNGSPGRASTMAAQTFSIAALSTLSGPISSSVRSARISAKRLRARLTRLLMVPTATPQISAACS
jgi:hypothetical protein